MHREPHICSSAQHLNHIYGDARQYTHADGRCSGSLFGGIAGLVTGGWQVAATPRLITALKKRSLPPVAHRKLPPEGMVEDDAGVDADRVNFISAIGDHQEQSSARD